MSAIDHAMMILSWHENIIDKDEIPPKWMWHLDWELSAWWEDINMKRKDKDYFSSSERDAELAEREENVFADRFKKK